MDNDCLGGVVDSVYSNAEIQSEAERLHGFLKHVGWSIAECAGIAGKTLRIRELARQKRAVILGHSYVAPEVIFGVADHRGDSLGLSVVARDTDAEIIVFCGVRFMGETAKIIAPSRTVLMPVPNAGCSLSESITAEDVRRFRRDNPDYSIVCYVNTSAAVKAECDACCTSANALAVVDAAPSSRVFFLPDGRMASNLASMTTKTIRGYAGNCIVHDGIRPEHVAGLRSKAGPGACVMVHTESPPEIVAMADVAGGTGDMMKAVKSGRWDTFVVVTEDGMTDRFRIEFPEYRFFALGTVCPHMKMIGLDQVLQVLESPRPDQVVELDEDLRLRALKAIERMFELTGKGRDDAKPHSNTGDVAASR